MSWPCEAYNAVPSLRRIARKELPMSELLGIVRNLNRLSTLARTGLLDTPPEEAFDRFTRIATRWFKTPVALVSLVDRDRQFFKSAMGVPEPWRSRRETPLE